MEERRQYSVDRVLGEHTAQLSALTSDISEIKDDIKLLLATKNQQEGSKRTMVALATVIGSFSGAAGAYALKLLGK